MTAPAPLTPAELDEIEQRVDAATRDEWDDIVLALLAMARPVPPRPLRPCPAVPVRGTGSMSAGAMTKGERTELGQLIRKREKVMKAAARERSMQLLSEFDTQSAQIYSFNDDAIWKQATEAAHAAAIAANEAILARCKELGIPPEFAPGVSFGWHGRGENAVAERRAELRRMAKSKIEKIEAETITKIERLSLSAQTEIVVSGLESEAAKDFLERMPAIDVLMPPVDAVEVKALVEKRKPKQSWSETWGSTEV